MTEYKTIVVLGAYDFDITINLKLKNGWMLRGNLTIIVDPKSGNWYYTHSMTKYIPEEE